MIAGLVAGIAGYNGMYQMFAMVPVIAMMVILLKVKDVLSREAARKESCKIAASSSNLA